ncbi:uncharacterized protein LOC143885207 [Tasmannia lanceolata]|uniref:uncharacterized protein LOC143863301 n=1 Tax=Tasmannia lanceolata TaxID=3420 RepID=UPI004064C5F9
MQMAIRSRPLSLALEAFPCNLQEQLNRYMDGSQVLHGTAGGMSGTLQQVQARNQQLPTQDIESEMNLAMTPGVQVLMDLKLEFLHGGDALVLCFVDFTNPGCATSALRALQGYLQELV